MDQLRTGDVFDLSRIIEPVVIVGAGAIGTAVALLLAKLDVPIIIMDDDVVESHNLCNQCLYGPSHVGMPKVKAAAQALKTLTGLDVEAVRHRLTSGTIGDWHIFLCVDNILTRKLVGRWCTAHPGSTLVDGRMSAYDCSAYLMRRDKQSDRSSYLDTLSISDEDVHVDRTACGTVMSIGATAQMVASNMVWMWMDAVMGRPTPNAIHQGMKPWFNQHIYWE